MTTRSWMEVLPPATVACYPSSSWFIGEKMSGGGIEAVNWTPEENKRFEYALAKFDKDTPDRWEQVAASISGKTAWDVESHYRDLLDDVSDIEAGRIPCPGYDSSSLTLDWETNYGFEASTQPYCIGGKRSAARASDQERKKGVPWTEDEHKRFLFGLKKYGKGDWRNISRNFVITRTPTQVASHAQKYFIRLNSGGKDKRRSSIHDITTANLPDNRPPSPSQSSDPPTQTSLASTPIPSAPFSSILDSSHPNEATAILSSSVQGTTIRATKLWSDTFWSEARRSCTSEWHTRCYCGSGP
ncbi:Myb-like DNA-binding domain [Musa troglodytarum]|uniref:Transcription factor MYBS1 n=1 Tax=Musa troglodytarum TaxID=320322 RepID=A0A9E7HB02_9LILI|nr:Myb-like DNA-binding domain [Musa troglodytarum]URE29890.1 Myb-like DNA-binding domain [Musa troglodytarum]URE29891.1 Myb-like DNA-binding domain [Musa troglodytarum]URE29892.1 Myb-like DNA-binding domain [Musa troglodytarum]URE29893.1 Myb-like DNA-binding domain [Musa troglodytarum]